MSSHQYPEDEFDQAGKDRPVGVHRQRPSQWKTVLPFLLVLIIVPILAWGFVSLITGSSPSEDNDSQPEQTTVAVEEQTTEAEAEASEATEQESAEEETTEATEEETEQSGANKDASIAILNGTNVNGLAAGATEKLKADGFANVEAENAQGWVTEVTTIYYAPGDLAGAQQIGSLLGIDQMVENADVLGNYNYIVVLKGDYNG